MHSATITGITGADAAALLKFSPSQFRTVTCAGLIPLVITPREILYAREHITALASKLKLGPQLSLPMYDPVAVELYALHAHWRNTPDKRTETRCTKRCNELIAAQKVVRVTTVSKEHPDLFSSTTMRMWSSRGTVMTFLVGKYTYLSKAYADKLVETLAWPSVSDAAKTLGVTASRVLQLLYAGQLTSRLAPNGHRINPRSIRARSLPCSVMSIPSAAAMLGVRRRTIDSALAKGVLTSKIVNNRYVLDRKVILALVKKFKTVNQGFEWLYVAQPKRNEDTLLGAVQLSRLFNVSTKTIDAYLKDDALPYYPRGFGRSQQPTRGIPKTYVDHFLQYAEREGKPVRRSLLMEYKQRCAARGTFA